MAETPYRAVEPQPLTCAACPAALGDGPVYLHDGQRVCAACKWRREALDQLRKEEVEGVAPMPFFRGAPLPSPPVSKTKALAIVLVSLAFFALALGVAYVAVLLWAFFHMGD